MCTDAYREALTRDLSSTASPAPDQRSPTAKSTVSADRTAGKTSPGQGQPAGPAGLSGQPRPPAPRHPVRTGGISCSGAAGRASGWRASRPGHHIHRPRSRFSAVTRTERTTMVSSSTPNATAKPSSASNDQRQRAEHGEGAGQHQAGRGDHAAGGGQPDQRAAPGAVPLGLLAHPGHQEDVVVDARARPGTRTRTAGTTVSAPAKPKTCSNTSALTPSAARERQHHGRDQHQRRDDRAQQQHQDQQHDDQHERDDQRCRSCAAARWMSRLIAVVPPTSASAPGTACTAARTRSIVALAAGLSGAARQRAVAGQACPSPDRGRSRR